mgnify:CR=1 FL=1
MFMRKVACFLCLQGLYAAAGMLVCCGWNACAVRPDCLCGSAAMLVACGSVAFRDGKRCFRTLFGVLFLYFICKYFAIVLCFCRLRIFAFETTANLGIGPEKRILKGLEKQSVKM